MFPRSENNPYIALRCYEDSDLGLFLNPYHPPYGWNFEECDEIITGIDEINADIPAYKTRYKNLLFVVYDMGCIRDISSFVGDIESNNKNVSVIVVKH